MTRMHAWSPVERPDAAPRQQPHREGCVSGDGGDGHGPGSGTAVSTGRGEPTRQVRAARAAVTFPLLGRTALDEG